MRLGLKSLLLLGAALATAALAEAPAQISAREPETMLALMKAEGLNAELRGGRGENPYISSEYGGAQFLVVFMNCDDKFANCKTVQFYMGFSGAKGVELDSFNAWNRDSRFARAYRDDEGDPVLEMDLDLDFAGLPRENVAEALTTWFGLMQAYRDFIFEQSRVGRE